MGKIAILSIYDELGTIDSYLLYYIKELQSVVDELIVVINGQLKESSLYNLRQLTDKVLIRENVGYDFGGYKYVFLYYGKQYFLNFDQVILTNDTNFGPFQPLKAVLEKIPCPYDVASMGINNRDWMSMLHGYFLIVNKRAMGDIFDYICAENTANMSKADIVIRFEIELTMFIKRKGYQYAVYTDTELIDLYRSPNYAIKEYNFPFMKKRCFEKQLYNKDNCIDALKYIKNNYEYDIDMILKTAYKRYDVKYDLNLEFSRKLSTEKKVFPDIKLKEEVILNLSKYRKKVFIYGAGDYGRILYDYFGNKLKFEGFVVSDDQPINKSYCNLPVYKISDVDERDAKFIVAIRNAEALYKNYGERDNFLFLW